MASRNDPIEAAGASSETGDDERDAIRTVGDLSIATGKNVPSTVTVGSGVVAVTLAIQTPAGEVSVSLSQSDAEQLGESLKSAAADLDDEGAERGEEWLQQYRTDRT